MRKRILITGVAGFVGSNLARHLLDRDYAVIGVDNLAAGTLENIDSRVELHRLDIRDSKIASHFPHLDAVFHLAAKCSLTDCLNNPLEAASVNVMGTVNVLEAARMANVPKLIYADTSAEYEGVSEFPTGENKVSPIGVYAASKHGGAAFCDSYRKLFGLDITTVRYFNVYGPAQDWRRVIPPVMSAFIIRMLSGQRPIIYGDGEKRRDFIYVDDVNSLHQLLLEDPRSKGRVFNVGSGTNLSINEVYELIEAQLRTGLKPIYQAELPGEARTTLADISSAKALGWKPKVDIEEGLRRSIRFVQEKVLENLKAAATEPAVLSG
jgi:UDP-glucose 4-epimerase